jgi:hypothetical protein
MKPGRWQEGENRVVLFSEEDPAAFGIYLDFVYHPYRLDIIARNLTWATFDTEYTGFCGVYVVADMLMDDGMKEAVFEQLKAISVKKFLPSSLATEERHHAPPVEAIQFIYNDTTEKDPMRRLLIDLFIANGDMFYAPHILTPSPSSVDLPPDLTRDLALSLMSARALPQTTEDATAEITALKCEVHVVTYERDLAERRIEGHQLRKKRLADDIKELRTQNNDWAELGNRDPD